VDLISDLNILKDLILNDENSIIIRNNVLFRLKDINNLECIKILEQALIQEKSSDLLRHELCYVLGQMVGPEENKKEIQEFFGQRSIF